MNNYILISPLFKKEEESENSDRWSCGFNHLNNERGRPCVLPFVVSLATVEKEGGTRQRQQQKRETSSPVRGALLLVFGGVVPLNPPPADRPFPVASRRPYVKDGGCGSR